MNNHPSPNHISSSPDASGTSDPYSWAQTMLEDPPEAALPASTESIPEETPSTPTAEALQKAQNFYRRHQKYLNFFAKDSSLNFSPAADEDTFSFEPKHFRVNAPLSWFTNEAYTEDELQFANLHEIAHFIDMRKNPQAYLENFDQMATDADSLATAYQATHPDESANHDAIKNFYNQELHTLYNCLDDIYVNNVVFGRSKNYRKGDGRNSVNTLYQKVGYENPDFTKQPLHRQFAFSLLRDEMVGNAYGPTQVQPEVAAALSKKIIGFSLKDRIYKEVKPDFGLLKDPAERYRFIRQIVQPEYLNLLQAALDQAKQNQQDNNQDENTEENSQNDQNNPQNGQNNQNNNKNRENSAKNDENNAENSKNNENSAENSEKTPQNSPNNDSSSTQSPENHQPSQSSSEFDPFGDSQKSQNTPTDFLDKGADQDQVIKDILKSFIEDDQEKQLQKELSKSEYEQYQNQKRQEEFDQSHHITAKERHAATVISQEIRQPRQAMRDFWRKLVGKSIAYRTNTVHNQRKGRFNVNSYIKQYPQIAEASHAGNLREMNIYDRHSLERINIDQPETIDVTLLVDCSGSMSDDKVEAAKKSAALLMYSLKDFNTELDRTRRYTHSKLRANTQLITYGSDFKEVKPFNRRASKDANDADVIKSLSAINGNMGGTDDAAPLASIHSSLTPTELKNLKNQKLKKIIFNITDGQPNSPSYTSAYIQELAKEGVILVGFQIGNVSPRERQTFDSIWNPSTPHPNQKGIFVGQDINHLPKRLMDSLSNLLGNITI